MPNRLRVFKRQNRSDEFMLQLVKICTNGEYRINNKWHCMKYIYGTLNIDVYYSAHIGKSWWSILKLPSVSNVRYKCHDFVQMNIELWIGIKIYKAEGSEFIFSKFEMNINILNRRIGLRSREKFFLEKVLSQILRIKQGSRQAIQFILLSLDKRLKSQLGTRLVNMQLQTLQAKYKKGAHVNGLYIRLRYLILFCSIPCILIIHFYKCEKMVQFLFLNKIWGPCRYISSFMIITGVHN